MLLWWIGNLVLALVIIPVVLVLLNRLLTPVIRIRNTADAILAEGVRLAGQLQPVPGLLAKTDETVAAVAVGAVRYAGSAAKLLPAEA